MKIPCYNCPDRSIGCHSACDKYLAFRREREAEYAQNVLNGAASYGCKQSHVLQRCDKKHLKNKKRGR